MKLQWFERDMSNIDAAEFVDNCQEIITKLTAIERLRDNIITLDEFWKEIE